MCKHFMDSEVLGNSKIIKVNQEIMERGGGA